MYTPNTNEPRHEKICFLHMQKQRRRLAAQLSCAVTAQLISAFVSATYIEQFLYFFNPEFEASIHFMLSYSPVRIGPARKPENRFSRDVAQIKGSPTTKANTCMKIYM